MNNDRESVIYNDTPRKKNNNSNLLVVVVCLVAVVLVSVPFIFMAILTFRNSDFNYTYTHNEQQFDEDSIMEADDYSITNVTSYYDTDTKTYYIDGYFSNESGHSLDSVWIEYYVYNKDGVILGKADAFMDGIKEGQTWKFKATYYELDSDEVSSFELSVVEVY